MSAPSNALGPPPPSSPAKPRTTPIGTRPLTLLDCVASSSTKNDQDSRARILEQQREVMLRRRQEAIRADVVRSVDDPQQQHFAPTIPQFSSPRFEDPDPTSAFSSTGGAGSSTLSSTLSSTASSTALLNPTQVTEAKRGPSSAIQPPRGGAGKPRSSAAATFRAKSYRRVCRSSGEEEEDGKGGGGLLGRQGSLSADEEKARDGAFLHSSPARPPKPAGRRRKDNNDLSLAAAAAAADEERRQGFDLEAALLGPSGVARFVTAPCPQKAGVVQCYIKRSKKGPAGKLSPEYYLYTNKGDRFLLAAKRRAHNATSNYVITLSDRGDFGKEGPEYVGKLRANFVGTEFQIFDHGLSPAELEGSGGGIGGSGSSTGGVREELGAVLYAANVLGSRGPRRMQVYLPRIVQRDDAVVPWREPQEMGKPDALLERVRRGDTGAFHHFINKPPRWNDQVGAYVLNFNGRVTQASVKNFQLIAPTDHEAVALQFGRVGKNEFTMDLRWPFSPLQAFAVALSSFDSKIACD